MIILFYLKAKTDVYRVIVQHFITVPSELLLSSKIKLKALQQAMTR